MFINFQNQKGVSMKIVPKKLYQVIMIGIISFLSLLTLSLVIATATIAAKPNLVVKNELGEYDAKNRVFYPKFDDLKVQDLYNNQYPEGREVGLNYSDIFKDGDKSLLKYTFGSNELGTKNFLKLKSSETTITLHRKTKLTFSKKSKEFKIKVNWKNVMFVRDGDKEVASLLKSTVHKADSFNDLKTACNFRYGALSKEQKETNQKIEFSNYYVAAISHGGGYKSILKNIDNADFDLAEDNKRNESITNANYLELLSKKTNKAPYPVLTFEVKNNRKTLIKTEMIKGSYKITNTTGADYEKWGYSNTLFESFDDEAYTKVNEGNDIAINKPTYIYAIFKLDETEKNVNVKYEFQHADKENEYEKDQEFAQLEKSIVTYNSKKGDKITINKLDIYAPDRDERLKLINPNEWDRQSIKYEKKPEIYYTSDKHKQEKSTEANIIDDGSINFTVIFRYKRKRVLVSFAMPDGSNPSTISEQTVLFGAMMQPITTSVIYRQNDWDSETYAKLKYFSQEKPDYANDYSQEKPKFDIETYVFGEADFVTPTKKLYPVWEKASNIPIKLKVYGQDTYGVGFNSDNAVYLSSLNKKDGDKIKVSEVLDFIKTKIDDTIYEKENITFKYADNVIEQYDDIDVVLLGITIEFYVNRKITTITLNTNKTIDLISIVGAVEITNSGKTLRYRHGYIFNDDEYPSIQDDNEEQFLGWQRGSNDFEFSGYEIIENISLVPKLKKKDARVVINLNSIRGDGLRYADSLITAAPDSSYSRIVFQLPYESFKDSPYQLVNLRINDGALMYHEITQKGVTQTGYMGETIIRQAGKTYEVSVQYYEDEAIYRGMYPQSKVELGEVVGAKIYARALVATFNEPTKYGEIACTFAYKKGIK